MTPPTLSAAEARAIALTAQGLGTAPPAKAGMPQVRRVAKQLHALQIDSVNVLTLAHYLPGFSRLGPYQRTALDRLINDRHELIEHRHAHQASFVPVQLEPLLRWRADDPRQQWRKAWRASVDAAYIDTVLRQVAERGPLALSDLDDPRRRAKQTPSELTVRRRDGKPYAESSLRWARSADGKTVLDGLLNEGVLALAGRRGVARLYDLAERVIPAEVRDRATPPPETARRELVRLTSRALGVATIADLANYFQLKSREVRPAVKDLVAAGAIQEVKVEGWKAPAFLAVNSTVPSRITAHSLIGPFDSLTWSRDRVRRLFEYEFSFEIYVPEPKRRYGYYVLPLLLGDRLVARVDLKADRQRAVLVVGGAHLEPGTDAAEVASALRHQLERMATWLSLQDIEVGQRGDLAPLLV